MKMTVLGLMAIPAFAVIATSGTATASGKCPLTYETFEASVPHVDLEHCPGGETGKGIFCRASTGGDRLHVFYFADKGDLCLLQVKSFDEHEFSLTVKPR